MIHIEFVPWNGWDIETKCDAENCEAWRYPPDTCRNLQHVLEDLEEQGWTYRKDNHSTVCPEHESEINVEPRSRTSL